MIVRSVEDLRTVVAKKARSQEFYPKAQEAPSEGKPRRSRTPRAKKES